ncbi:MAG: hypothetical protein MZV65_13945 [Chromatiales bacterium]|nr:hypothetical protein [Chromatiales bacterium]
MDQLKRMAVFAEVVAASCPGTARHRHDLGCRPTAPSAVRQRLRCATGLPLPRPGAT